MTHFKGSITALVTPFKNGAVDERAFQELVERQIAAGTHGLVPVGTTGESATLTDEEHERVITLCVEAAAGRAPVIGGAGSNETAYSISMAKRIQKIGVDAILSVTGYYNRPSQAGLVAHYTALHDATDVPIIIYNIPARTVVGLSRETMATLSKLPRIIGVKDATADLARVALQRRECGEDFIQLSGEDMTAVGFNAMGGTGCISVTSNVAPELCAHMQNACLGDDYVTARALQDRLAPLHDALFSDASPGPVKYAMSLLGLMSDELRLPMVAPNDAAKAKVKAALEEIGLLG
ncbi:4-hydroxy-tetrahydrodipicolinate synthase [Hyphococcus luteus]|uniref:4-hydroxy-tetrahydrodipicolinate synthase n=1 Tax=Hyphococcus luteus TaxID=2058213 RepID=A0A2S7K1S0_9PROT|nr:4-hydroxy-tetrahydrodipicolinate synthase [Marinicaulis flavus]PQA86454.1 4-hydroxy-tetrahydrodipicolinate synthase [Marinicaulis flavus]